MDRAQKIKELMGHMHSLRRKAAFRPKGLFKMTVTPAQLGVMRLIRERGTCTIKDVAQAFGVTSSAATQLVDGLVAGGYVVKDEHARDRRSVELTLSKKAEREGNKIEAEAAKRFVKMFSALSDAELAQLGRLMGKIVQKFTTR